MKNVLMFCIVCLLFSGCGPRFIVKNEYVPPIETENSKKCLNTCNITSDFCQQKCQNNYKDCSDKAFNTAKNIEKQEVIKYNNEVRHYQDEYYRYERENRMFEDDYYRMNEELNRDNYECRKHNDRFSCDRANETKNRVEHLRHKKPYPPIQPEQPNFNVILSDQQRVCESSKECGCQNTYDQCFSSCGGKINFQRICVDNCN